MTSFVLPLDQISREQTPIVGIKAGALGELATRFRVPRGFVLTTAAYAEFIAPLGRAIRARLTDEVIMDPSEIESAAEEIRGWLQALPLSPVLRVELEAALAQFNDVERASCAVRTSSPSDDLATAFGSGVARAYLGLVGADEIAAAAARCWAAVWNSRSMYYRHRKKIAQTDIALAVLVQPMVRARSAGVMFTQNPMNGAQGEMEIHSIWGLGAPLTSARLRPTRFVVERASGTVCEQAVETQLVELVVGADGHTLELGIPAERTEASSISDGEVHVLAGLGKQVEEFMGAPQDIEWAIAGNETFLLQARPVGIRTA